MFTPKEIQEKTFEKAVFGGYDMKAVDEFLEPLTEDYGTLYKENSVLKSKLKVLVEKMEEYRGQESTLKRTLVSAQQTADNIIAEAQKKASKILNEAENAAANRTADAEKEINAAEEKVERAKAAANSFISIVEKEVARHADMLEQLKRLSDYREPAPAQPSFRPETVPAPEAVPQEAPRAAKKPEMNLEEDLATEIGATVQEVEKSNRKTRESFFEQLKLDEDFDLPEE